MNQCVDLAFLPNTHFFKNSKVPDGLVGVQITVDKDFESNRTCKKIV